MHNNYNKMTHRTNDCLTFYFDQIFNKSSPFGIILDYIFDYFTTILLLSFSKSIP